MSISIPKSSRPGSSATTDLPPAPRLYRMWIKATSPNRADAERTCLDLDVLGMGWGTRWIPDAPVVEGWEDYWNWATGPATSWDSRELANVRRLHDADADGLVWWMNRHGTYHLGRFAGEWEHRTGWPYDEHDLNNIRPAHSELIGGENEVPGAVVRRFSRQGQTFCQVHDESAARYSALLWAKQTGQRYDWRPSVDDVLDTLLSAFDVQDLIAAYLEVERGWVLFPSRLSDSTAAYEYILRDPSTGESYAVQVKTGDQHINVGRLEQSRGLDGWVVFSTRGFYDGEPPTIVEELDRNALLDFMRQRPSALPPIVATWLETSSATPTC